MPCRFRFFGFVLRSVYPFGVLMGFNKIGGFVKYHCVAKFLSRADVPLAVQGFNLV